MLDPKLEVDFTSRSTMCLVQRLGVEDRSLTTGFARGEQVRGGEEAAASLAPEDEVEFDVVFNRKTGGFRAEDVELLCKAEDRRELGQVSAFLVGDIQIVCDLIPKVCSPEASFSDHSPVSVMVLKWHGLGTCEWVATCKGIDDVPTMPIWHAMSFNAMERSSRDAMHNLKILSH